MSSDLRHRSVPGALAAVLAVVALLAGVLFAPAAHAAGAYVWIGGTDQPQGDGHSWGDANNWSTHQVPTTGSDVVITPPGPAQCYARVDGIPTITLHSLTFGDLPDGGTSVCDAELKDGDITVTGSLSWNAGVIDGKVTVAAGATGTVRALPGAAANSILFGTLTVAGTLSVADTAVNADLDQAFAIAGGATLAVAPGGRLTTAGRTDVVGWSCCDPAPRIVNAGTVAVSGTTHLTAVELDQDHVLDVASGATLTTDNAPASAANASYTGGGTWRLAQKSVTTFAGTQHVGPSFHLVLGGAHTDSTETLGGRFTLTAGTLDWQGGHLSANVTIARGATLRANGKGTVQDRRTLTGRNAANTANVLVRGSLVANGSPIAVVDRPLISVPTGGRLSLGAGTTLGGAVIGNSGTLAAPAGARTTATVTNRGTVTLGGGLSVAAFAQAATARTTLTLSAKAGGALHAAQGVRLAGTLAVTNSGFRPTSRSVRTVATAGTALHSSLRCVVTVGSGTTGRTARHWSPRAGARSLVLRSVAGRHVHC